MSLKVTDNQWAYGWLS